MRRNENNHLDVCADMHARLMANINNRSGFAWEVLHTASLMQEVSQDSTRGRA